jgi:hypothetical protein
MATDAVATATLGVEDTPAEFAAAWHRASVVEQPLVASAAEQRLAAASVAVGVAEPTSAAVVVAVVVVDAGKPGPAS